MVARFLTPSPKRVGFCFISFLMDESLSAPIVQQVAALLEVSSHIYDTKICPFLLERIEISLYSYVKIMLCC